LVPLELTDYKVSLTGLHARNEKTIQATQDWERSRINEAALKATLDKDCDSIVELQKHVGAEFITDGQLTLAWQDLFRPISTGFEGVEPGPMVRWFNTNTFFYTPVVKGPISSDGTVLSRAIQKRFTNHGSSLKVILPDPLTFAELAEDRHYGSKEKVLFAYSDAIRKELRKLSSLGVKYVQFSAPSLVYRLTQKPFSSAAVKQLGESLRNALKGVSMRSGFYPFFGDASPYLPELFDVIPTDDIGVDLTQTDDSSLSPTSKGIIAGVVDSRTTYLEDIALLVSRVERVVERTGVKTLTLGPSADLRYIPRVSADEKLELLGRLRARVRHRTDSPKAKPPGRRGSK
jgi:5-methyltetrahydropteroyltriglutamate--homocysteine methyltransferase